MKTLSTLSILVLLSTAVVLAGCGEESANDQLIGAQCATVADCDDDDGDTPPLECLTQFAGGYCGRAGCTADADCPEDSLCAVLEGANYCFLVCTDKADCNQNRDVADEANCSSSVDPISGGEAKLCIPPSSGT